VTTTASHASAGCGKGHSAPKTISLAVVTEKPKGDKLHIRKSKSSRWRAAVLISVNLLMAAHIVLWYTSGHPPKPTLSPVEPSESMYTIELGQLNAGFVFFAAALLSTFIFGRFFCGWGCHVVSLQDLCSTIMNKLGVRPKPFRSRVLLWGPLLLALYMFAWVPFKRLVFWVLYNYAHIQWRPPSWLLTLPGPRPPFHEHFFVTEFWRTFPPWYVAIPFLLVCGFAVVYFLGSKGFCTYGCPYGGFFAPMDRISIGRIVVSDACEGCGHCTAVCTSNVRVHQEVRDFGMVVDPGCMKCLDCVSVCPNDALSFSFAAPAVLAKPRTKEARAGHIQRPEYDVTLGQDWLLFGLGILLFTTFRGMPFIAYKGDLGLVPLLMAAGMAAAGVFLTWKLCTLLVQPNVRLQNLQLRTKGRFRVAGAIFALGATGYLGVGVWAGAVQGSLLLGSIYEERVQATKEAVFDPGYQPDAADKANALKALRWIDRAGSPSEGGIGWKHNVQNLNDRAWLFAVAGDLPNAEKALSDAVALAKQPNVSAIFDLRQLILLQHKPMTDVDAMYERVLKDHPDLHPVSIALAVDMLQAGQVDRAVVLAQQVGAPGSTADPLSLARAGQVLLEVEKFDQGLVVLKDATAKYDDFGLLHAEYARALWLKDQKLDAIVHMRRASELEPQNAEYLHALAEMYGEMNRLPEAQDAEQRAQAIEAGTAPRK
jgi:tetratricopeptide (TPR) repeat protein/ferredoxin